MFFSILEEYFPRPTVKEAYRYDGTSRRREYLVVGTLESANNQPAPQSYQTRDHNIRVQCFICSVRLIPETDCLSYDDNLSATLT